METAEKCFKCMFCEKSYRFDRSLKKHIRASHDKSYGKKKCMKCAGCEETFHFRKDLRFHISSVHGEPMEVEEYTFETVKDFELWKEEIEKRMKCSYIKSQARKLVQSKEVLQYNCHRTGSYSGKGSRKREMKTVGTKKINAYCPSSMDVVITKNEVQVKFWKSHYGHKNELGHVWLSREEKCKIAEKIKQGASFQQILDEIRDSFSGEEINRIDLLCRKDLYNIARRFRVLRKDSMHTSDGSNIKSWVELMRCAQYDSPILYYKEQGEMAQEGGLDVNDFQLVIMAKFQEETLQKCGHLKVCIDSTLGTNSYDFQIITLLTIDETGSGCPVSFCFTNRIDEVGVEIFFTIVKEKVGIVNTTVFMSHDAPAFYDAWCKVMGPAHYQLLCSWHVDSSWRKNLQKIHGTPEKKIEVYQTLRMLLQENDKESFDLLHSRFIAALVADEDTKQFGAYFKKFYYDRCKMWALCYRLHLGINSNEQLESLHKKIKCYYLEGKSAKRVDNTLSLLLKVSREECFKRLFNVTDNVCSTKLKLSKQNHLNSYEILESMIIPIENNHWSIKCSDDETSSYDIKKLDDAICINKCGLVCEKCNICIHMYECTCLDNFVRCIICEHIHACATKPVSIIEPEPDDGVDACSSDESISSCFSDSILEKKMKRLKQELKSRALTEQDRIGISKSLDYCLSVCSKAGRMATLNETAGISPITSSSVTSPTILFVSKTPEPLHKKNNQSQLPASKTLGTPLTVRPVAATGSTPTQLPKTAILLVPKPPPPGTPATAPQPKLILIPTTNVKMSPANEKSITKIIPSSN